jgi:hypothetical protein
MTLIPSFLLIGRAAKKEGVVSNEWAYDDTKRKRAKFWIDYDQLFLVLALFHDDFVQELLQALAELPFLHRGDFLNGSRGRRESV